MRGTVGITPAGALGVAFFHHLSRREGAVCFVERSGSASGAVLREQGLRIGDRLVQGPACFRPPLMECAREGWLPEVLLVCTQPDQLHGVIHEWVQVFERLHAERSGEAVDALPVLALASNGIYFQRIRTFLIERLEEGTLMGRLPDLWPETMPRLVARLLRGVTIQTGHRTGNDYQPGPRGLTRVAGGDPALRQRVVELLNELGGWFEGTDATPTRVEFDKALVNLTANLLGQLAAIDDSGRFRRLTAGEMLAPEHAADITALVTHVLAIGRAVRAYTGETPEELEAALRGSIESHADHVPSSLQWIESALRRKALVPRLTPTETWLLEPLIRYAHAAGLESTAHYFEELTRQVEHRLARAIAARK